MGKQENLCMKPTTNGAYCTMPAGHSGDCIAESGFVGNIIDTGRRDDHDDD